MNKRSLILFGLLLVGGGLTWLLVYWYNERNAELPAFTQKDLAKASIRLGPTQPAIIPQAPIDPSQRIRLAVGWLGLLD